MSCDEHGESEREGCVCIGRGDEHGEYEKGGSVPAETGLSISSCIFRRW